MSELNQLDQRASASLRFIERTPGLRQAAIFAAHSADPWNCLIALILIILFAPPVWKTRGAILLAGTLLTAAVVFVIKYSVRRERPEGSWGGIYRLTNPHSFPSGHAARCVMLAVIGIALGPAWFAAFLLIWALLVSLARVGMGVHFVSDVTAGALLGIAVGFLTLAIFAEFQGWFLPFLTRLLGSPIPPL